MVFCSSTCHGTYQENKVSKVCKICNASFTTRASEVHKFSTCSKSCFLKAKSKDNNPNWRGGKCRKRRETSTKIYKDWRKSVLERDNKTCVMCLKQEKVMHADHIKPWAYFPELRYSVENGRTLCPPCHYSVFKEVLRWRG